MACDEKKKSVTAGECSELPGLLLSMITTGPTFKATPVQYADPAFWQTAIKAEAPARIYPWPNFATNEDVSTEAVYEDSVYGILPAHDGNYRWRQGYRQSICWHKSAFTHRSTSGRVILRDETKLIGMRDAAGAFMGLTKQLLHTEKMKFGDGAVSSKSPILIALANSKEFDRSGFMIDASVLDGLFNIIDLALTIVGVPTATQIIVNVATECDGLPLSGLVVADFIKLTAAGVAQTIATAPESATIPGQYTLTGTGFVTGTVKLKPAATLTLTAYDSEAVVVTI